MSVQRLSDKKIRKYEKITGIPFKMMWTTSNSQHFQFVTTDHKHGTVHRRGSPVVFTNNPTHFNTCKDMFPDDPTI
jgi:hypothetical protein